MDEGKTTLTLIKKVEVAAMLVLRREFVALVELLRWVSKAGRSSIVKKCWRKKRKCELGACFYDTSSALTYSFIKNSSHVNITSISSHALEATMRQLQLSVLDLLNRPTLVISTKTAVPLMGLVRPTRPISEWAFVACPVTFETYRYSSRWCYTGQL